MFWSLQYSPEPRDGMRVFMESAIRTGFPKDFEAGYNPASRLRAAVTISPKTVR